MSEFSAVQVDAVYECTPVGQSEVLHAQLPLSELERRLLGMLNGYTSMAHLQALMGMEAVSPEEVRHMLLLGLIRPCDALGNGHFNLGWPLRPVH